MEGHHKFSAPRILNRTINTHLMKPIFNLFSKLLIIGLALPFLMLSHDLNAQTTLINQAGDGGFETGNTMALNNWTVVNGSQTNQWVLGTAPTGYTGNRCAYISNDVGTSYAYTNSVASIVHFYMDVTLPSGEGDIELTFDIQGIGNASYDNLKVWLVPTSTTPVAGTAVSGTALGEPYYSEICDNGFVRTGMLIGSANAGTTKRIVFSWANNDNTGTLAPIAIDNVQLISKAVSSLAGSYTIDNTSPTGGSNFNNFVDAILRLNASGVSSTVVFNISSGQVFKQINPTITATGTAANTITFQKSGVGANPKSQFATSHGISNGAGIKIYGSDYLTIDGIDIENADPGTTAANQLGIRIDNASVSNGAQHNTIKNCSVTLSSTSTERGIYSYSSATSAAGANSYNKFQNNTISGPDYGISVVGATSYPDLGIEVSGCIVKEVVYTFIVWRPFEMSALSGLSFFSNEAYNINNTSSSFSIATFSLYGTNYIYNNSIHDLISQGTGTVNFNAYSISAYASSVINFYNNTAYNFTLSAATASATLRCNVLYCNSGTSSTGTVNAYNNSLSIGTNANSSSAVVNFGGYGTLNLKNNILENKSIAGATSERYVIYRTKTTGTFNSIDYNNLRIDTTGTNNYIGYFAPTTTKYSTLSSWRAATGKDAHSVSVDPGFLSSNDLHSNSPNINRKGIPITTAGGDAINLTVDFDGDTRDVSNPDIGADEFSLATTCATPINPVDGATSVAQTSGLSWNSAINATGYKFYFGTDPSATNIVNGVLQSDTTYTPPSNLAASTTYYWKVVPTSSEGDATGCPTWHFVTQTLTPSLSITSGLAAFGSQCVGTSSAEQSFTINGLNLTSDITIGSLAGFTYCLTAGGTYTNTLLVSPTGGAINNQPIYVRFNPASAMSYSGNITMTGGGLTTPVDQVASGTGAANYSGTYTVGTGGDFTTLTSAVNTYNTNACFTGNMVFNLIDANYSTAETFPITINSNSFAGVYTLTIKPSASAIISGSVSNDGVVKLNGADGVIIDGSNSGGTDKSLTIVNPNTVSPKSLVITSQGVGAGATNITIKNCVLSTGNGANSSSYGISIGGDDNENITIQDNSIFKCYTAISAVGSSVLNPVDNLVISGNSIGSNNVSDYVYHIGVVLSNVSNCNISQNSIFNIISSAIRNTGIEVGSGAIGINITGNEIRNVYYESSGTKLYGGYGVKLNTSSASSNITLANNFITGIIGAYSSNFLNGSCGILIDGTMGGVNIYHNTVNIYGDLPLTNTTTITAALVLNTSTITNIDVRNNIFVNSFDDNNETTDKNYAIYSSSASSAFTNIDYNVYYTSGPQGVLGYIGGTNRTTLAAMQAGFGGNTHSLVLNPGLTSDDDLHLDLTGANILAMNGSALAGVGGITTDIDDDPRSSGFNDIGADEVSLLVSCTTPISPLHQDINVQQTTGLSWNSAANASGYKLYFGTDASATNIVNGVLQAGTTYTPSSNLASSTLHYWKVVPVGEENEASGCSTWEFTTQAPLPSLSITSALAAFGTHCVGTTSAEQSFTINGLNLTGDISIAALTGFSYSLTSGGTYTSTLTVPQTGGVINSQIIYVKFSPATDGSYTGNIAMTGGGLASPVNQAASGEGGKNYSGTYNVGSGGDFATLTSAVTTYNSAVCFTGNLVFSLTDANYTTGETFPITINPNSNAGSFTLTIKPSTTAIISGSVNNGALLVIDGADNIIIDGSNSGGTDRNLTIANSSTTNPTSVNIVSQGLNAGATNNTVKNCVIYTGVRSTGSYGITIGGSTPGTSGADNDNVTIQNNHIYKAYVGIKAYGSGSSNPGRLDGLIITGNTIGSNTSTEYIGHDGIFVSDNYGSNISFNTVFNISSSADNPTGITVDRQSYLTNIHSNNINNINAENSFSLYGIKINTESSCGIKITNNLIYKLNNYCTASGTGSMPTGIYLDWYTSGISIYYNTINLYGNYAGTNTTTNSAAILINYYVTSIDLRNNILANTYNNTGSGTDKNYLIYSYNSSPFSSIDYNNYYAPSSSQGVLGYNSGDKTTMAAMQSGFGGNTHSISVNPAFASTTDYHISEYQLNNSGVAITGVTTDYEGTARGTIPDIGAYVITGSPLVTTKSDTLLKSQATTLMGSVNARNEDSYTMSFEWGPTASYGNTIAWATNPTASGTSLISESKELTGLADNTVYHYRVKAVGNGGATHYGDDQIFTTYLQPDVSPDITVVDNDNGTLTISWVNGDGDARLVVINNTNNFTQPTDRTDYSSQVTSTIWQNAGEQYVYDGSAGNSIIINGNGTLDSNNIWVAVFEYNLYSEAKANVKIYHVGGLVANFYGEMGALPISLVKFEAKLNNGIVNLEWQTASEHNNSHFFIEKTTDYEKFETVSIIEAGAEPNSTQIYETKDVFPFSGLSYYRLSQVDFDGKVTSFDPVSIYNYPLSNSSLSAYVLGKDMFVEFESNIKGFGLIEIYNVYGKLLRNEYIQANDGSNQLTINIEGLSKGTYIVSLKQEGIKLNTKVIIF